MNSLKYLLTISFLLIGCDSATAPTAPSSQQGVLLDTRENDANQMIDMEESAGEISVSYAGESTTDSIYMSGSEGYMSLDMGSSMTLDMGSSMTLDMGSPIIDMQIPPLCVDGDSRLGQGCGIDRCDGQQWIIDPLVTEACNQWDDDCDGSIDEDPNRENQMSDCCDEDGCAVYAYCEEGSCQPLSSGECRYQGDCAESEICSDYQCRAPYVINPPRDSASCQDPLIAMIGSVGQNGNAASYLFSANRCTDQAFRFQTALGPEMIFRLSISVAGRHAFTSRVTDNGRDVPSTLSLLSSCDPNGEAMWCYSSDIEGLTLGGGSLSLPNNVMFDLERGDYFLIVDTHYQELYDYLSSSEKQLSDLEFRLNVTRR